MPWARQYGRCAGFVGGAQFPSICLGGASAWQTSHPGLVPHSRMVVTMARSRAIDGPYEMHPQVHPITSKDAPEAVLQRAGHGQIVETPDGDFYHTHLTSRPLPGMRRSPLGRETAIQKCVWRDDGWLYLADGGPVPSVEVEAPKGAVKQEQPRSIRYSFSGKELPLDFQWLRTPEPERIFSLTAKPGVLRLFARESVGSWFEQALVARRQQHFSLARRDGSRVQPRHLPAGGRAHPLLQPPQVPLPRRQLRRAAGAHPHHHVLPRRLAGREAYFPAGRGDPAARRRAGGTGGRDRRREAAVLLSRRRASGSQSAPCSTPA